MDSLTEPDFWDVRHRPKHCGGERRGFGLLPGTPALCVSFYTTVSTQDCFKQARFIASTTSLVGRPESGLVTAIEADADICANQMGEGLSCFPGTGVGTNIFADPKVRLELR